MNYIYLLELAFLIIIAIAALIYAFWGLSGIIGLLMTRGVPFVPLNDRQLKYVKDNLPSLGGLSVVDLGCGDGRVLRLFEKMGAAFAIGYELNAWAYWRARLANFFSRSKTIVRLRDFRTIDLSQHDVVFCYLLAGNLRRLRPLFETKLKKGAWLVSYAFPIPDWREPDKTIITNAEMPEKDRLYLYKINN